MSDAPAGSYADREVSLVEVLDRALGAGVVLSGDITLSLADIDLVQLSLRLVVGSVSTLQRAEVGGDAERRPEPIDPAAPEKQ